MNVRTMESEDKASNTKKVVRLDQADSPLFQLPPELRNITWRYLLGDQFLHLSYPLENRSRFCYSICHRKTSECSAESQFFESKLRTETRRAVELFHLSNRRHSSCVKELERQERLSRFSLGPEPGDRLSSAWRYWQDTRENSSETPRLDVAILRTCWRSYAEAQTLLFSTNTFSFRDGGAFRIHAKANGCDRQMASKNPP